MSESQGHIPKKTGKIEGYQPTEEEKRRMAILQEAIDLKIKRIEAETEAMQRQVDESNKHFGI